MIQFNLLPDVKIEYIRAQRLKRAVVLVSTVVSIVSVVFLIMTFVGVVFVQTSHLSNLDRDIKAGIKEIQETGDINKVLTIQNQLKSLTKLHADKPVVTRLLGYIEQITPATARISDFKIDYENNKIEISGDADSIVEVNRYVDTLKFTMYIIDGDTKNQTNAFSSVVLGSFSVSPDRTSYTITSDYDPKIFDVEEEVVLVVPDSKITTRSETEKPGPLFVPNPDQIETGE